MKVWFSFLFILLIAVVGADVWLQYTNRLEVRQWESGLTSRVEGVESSLADLEASISRLEAATAGLADEASVTATNVTEMHETMTRVRNSLSTVSLVLSKMKRKFDDFYHGASGAQ